MTVYAEHGAALDRHIKAGDEIKASANYYDCTFYVERGAIISEFAGFHHCAFRFEDEPVTREQLLARLAMQQAA